jgi:hypothetical protein
MKTILFCILTMLCLSTYAQGSESISSQTDEIFSSVTCWKGESFISIDIKNRIYKTHSKEIDFKFIGLWPLAEIYELGYGTFETGTPTHSFTITGGQPAYGNSPRKTSSFNIQTSGRPGGQLCNIESSGEYNKCVAFDNCVRMLNNP